MFYYILINQYFQYYSLTDQHKQLCVVVGLDIVGGDDHYYTIVHNADYCYNNGGWQGSLRWKVVELDEAYSQKVPQILFDLLNTCFSRCKPD